MAYNTTAIKTDVNGKPIPQYFDPLADEYKPLLGVHGAARAILYGPNGQPIGTQTNPLDVRVRELEAKLDELKQTIESGVQLKGSDMELYGATVDDRPAAGSVPVGATFIAVNTLDAWMSNGSDWVVVV